MCGVGTGWNQAAENRASRPMAGQIRRNPLGLPRVPRLGSRSYLRPISRCRPLTDTSRVESGARPAVANWWISNREGVSQRGAIQIHPLIRLACDSWQRRDQQLSIRRGSVRSSVLVWNAAARSRIGATAGGYREATKFCQPSCQRKAAKNAGWLSGEGQAVLCVQTAKKRPFSLTQNQPRKTGKVAAWPTRSHGRSGWDTRTHP